MINNFSTVQGNAVLLYLNGDSRDDLLRSFVVVCLAGIVSRLRREGLGDDLADVVHLSATPKKAEFKLQG